MKYILRVVVETTATDPEKRWRVTHIRQSGNMSRKRAVQRTLDECMAMTWGGYPATSAEAEIVEARN